MNVGSHVATGALAGLLLAQTTTTTLQDTALLVGITAVAALLPDIDHPNATINQKLIVTKLVAMIVGHRGITHSVWVLAMIAGLAIHSGLLAMQAVLVGYGVHIAVDMLTQRGVMLFAPVSRRSVHLLPRPIRLRAGVWWQETPIVFGCIAAAILMTM